MQSMEATYEVYESNLKTLADRIEKLSKRAVRLKSTPITMTAKPGKVMWRVTNSHGERTLVAKKPEGLEAARMRCHPVQFYDVTITGERPCFNGWSLAATLEPMETDDGAGLNVLQCVPGVHVPPEYRNMVNVCQHCNVKRRRSQTFIVKHENGEFKSIGRNCIRDFLGHTCPHHLAELAEMWVEIGELGAMDDDEGFYGGGGWRRDKIELHQFMTWACGVIAKYGFMSATKAREINGTDEVSMGNKPSVESTRSRLVDLLFPPPNMTRQQRERWQKEIDKCMPTEEHKVEADEAIAWGKALTLDQIEKSEYLANVNAVCRCVMLDQRFLGVAASIVSAMRRDKQREQERQNERKGLPPSEYVGKVGKREVFTLTIKKVIPLESDFGINNLHLMTDKDGNEFRWFSSTMALDVGRTYELKGTVKKHEEYKDRKQTVLTRCKVQEKSEPEVKECKGHLPDPGNPSHPQGQTVYCDGSCRKVIERAVQSQDVESKKDDVASSQKD